MLLYFHVSRDKHSLSLLFLLSHFVTFVLFPLFRPFFLSRTAAKSPRVPITARRVILASISAIVLRREEGRDFGAFPTFLPPRRAEFAPPGNVIVVFRLNNLLYRVPIPINLKIRAR